MKLILAMDLRQNLVVHGRSGQRRSYKPLDWGRSPSADPTTYIRTIRPKYLYIADLDRIEGTGSHDDLIRSCAGEVCCCYVDRGARSPTDLLAGEHIVNVIGTETGGSTLSQYHGGILSVDVKGGTVIPCGRDPIEILKAAGHWDFDGCLLLNIDRVGTGGGIDPHNLEEVRGSYARQLLYGGGVAGCRDLEVLAKTGFDGAIISTALHKGDVPVEWVRQGWCRC